MLMVDLYPRLYVLLIVGQMKEKFRVKGKKQYFGFVDLEKAFERVPREVIKMGNA